jgi:hypothetical protein
MIDLEKVSKEYAEYLGDFIYNEVINMIMTEKAEAIESTLSDILYETNRSLKSCETAEELYDDLEHYKVPKYSNHVDRYNEQKLTAILHYGFDLLNDFNDKPQLLFKIKDMIANNTDHEIVELYKKKLKLLLDYTEDDDPYLHDYRDLV